MQGASDILNAACRLIAVHGGRAAEEADQVARMLLREQGKRAALRWDRIAVTVRTIQDFEIIEPGRKLL